MATRDNPLCFAVYEKNRLCAACYEPEDGVYECTALNNTDPYMDDCPFFIPMCVHRHNAFYGFSACEFTSGKYQDCDAEGCPFFKEVKVNA